MVLPDFSVGDGLSLIYNDDIEHDKEMLTDYFNAVAVNLEVSDMQYDTAALNACLLSMRQPFPHVDGLSKASVFKKVANFIAHFMFHRPIRSQLDNVFRLDLDSYDINAVFAIEIAFYELQDARIFREGEPDKVISKPLYLSNHSYQDLVDTLSTAVPTSGEMPSEMANQALNLSYRFLTIYVEQLAYKTNGHCQYEPDDDGGGTPSGGGYGIYQEAFPVTDGDDLEGV